MIDHDSWMDKYEVDYTDEEAEAIFDAGSHPGSLFDPAGNWIGQGSEEDFNAESELRQEMLDNGQWPDSDFDANDNYIGGWSDL